MALSHTAKLASGSLNFVSYIISCDKINYNNVIVYFITSHVVLMMVYHVGPIGLKPLDTAVGMQWFTFMHDCYGIWIVLSHLIDVKTGSDRVGWGSHYNSRVVV